MTVISFVMCSFELGGDKKTKGAALTFVSCSISGRLGWLLTPMNSNVSMSYLPSLYASHKLMTLIYAMLPATHRSTCPETP